MCGPKFCSMKITQDLRAEVQALNGAAANIEHEGLGENERRALEVTSAEAEARADMAAKSAEFLAGGGKLYVGAAE